MSNSFPTPDLETLPDDLTALKSMVQTLHEALNNQNETIERLRHQLYLAVKHRYGRKSEQISDDQLSIFLREIEAKTGQAPDPVETETITYTRKKGHGRNPSVENLPVYRVEHPLPEEKKTCPECHGQLSKMGVDEQRTMEYIPSFTYIREDVLEKWACPCCKNAPVTSEGPIRPLERSLAGPGLLASVVTSKYADHLPLYRQSEIYERGGLEVCRSTLCDWVGGVAGLDCALPDGQFI